MIDLQNIKSVKEIRDITKYSVSLDSNGNKRLEVPPVEGYILTVSEEMRDRNIYVPVDVSNKYYQLIQSWIKLGNTPQCAHTKEELLEHYKKVKLKELKISFEDYRYNKAKIFSKTINKYVDARERDLINIDALISSLPDNNTTIQFRTYENDFIEVTKPQLESIKQEIIAYGLKLYQRKWEIEKKISNETCIINLIEMKITDELWDIDDGGK